MTTLSSTLTARRAMTLLFSLAIEGEKALDLYDHMPEREARELRTEASRLLEVPKDARVPFLLREMKRFRSLDRSTGLGPVDEEWILRALSRERPRVIRVVLETLPEEQAGRLLRALPLHLAEAVGSVDADADGPAAIRDVVFRRFEGQFVAVEDLRLATRFDYVVSLRARDVSGLVRGLGLDEMAVAFRGVSREQVSQLLRNMGGLDERELIARMKEYAQVDRRRVKQALRDVSAALGGGLQTTDLPVKVGLDRLARAAVPADPSWCRFLAQRLPVSTGDEFLRLREAAAGTEMEVAGRLQRATVEEVRRMAREGRLHPKWTKLYES